MIGLCVFILELNIFTFIWGYSKAFQDPTKNWSSTFHVFYPIHCSKNIMFDCLQLQCLRWRTHFKGPAITLCWCGVTSHALIHNIWASCCEIIDLYYSWLLFITIYGYTQHWQVWNSTDYYDACLPSTVGSDHIWA